MDSPNRVAVWLTVADRFRRLEPAHFVTQNH